jgi:hypothetical protein
MACILSSHDAGFKKVKYIPAILFAIAALSFGLSGAWFPAVMFTIAATFWCLGAAHPCMGGVSGTDAIHEVIFNKNKTFR